MRVKIYDILITKRFEHHNFLWAVWVLHSQPRRSPSITTHRQLAKRKELQLAHNKGNLTWMWQPWFIGLADSKFVGSVRQFQASSCGLHHSPRFAAAYTYHP